MPMPTKGLWRLLVRDQGQEVVLQLDQGVVLLPDQEVVLLPDQGGGGPLAGPGAGLGPRPTCKDY